MSRLWILPALGLIAVLGLACGDLGDDLTQSAGPTTSSVSASPTGSTSPAPTASNKTPEPVPSGWATYNDSQLGFSLPAPSGLTRKEQLIDLPENGGLPATQLRAISFERADGVPVVGVSVTPNPAGVSLEEWIRMRPGWPCEPGASPTCDPEEVRVAEEKGIRFSIDVIGEPAATIYFAHHGVIYALSGNLFGSGEGGYGPALTESELKAVLQDFRFGQQ